MLEQNGLGSNPQLLAETKLSKMYLIFFVCKIKTIFYPHRAVVGIEWIHAKGSEQCLGTASTQQTSAVVTLGQLPDCSQPLGSSCMHSFPLGEHSGWTGEAGKRRRAIKESLMTGGFCPA